MQTIELDPDTERAARSFLRLLSGRYQVAGAILFGSRARGSYRPDSDADGASAAARAAMLLIRHHEHEIEGRRSRVGGSLVKQLDSRCSLPSTPLGGRNNDNFKPHGAGSIADIRQTGELQCD
jgi:hypothetical protein